MEKKEIVIDGKTYILKEESTCQAKYKVGNWVKVVKTGQNASDFNHIIGISGRGIYDTVDWKNKVFRIDGEIKEFDGGKYVPDSYCYALKFNDDYCGYVYERALELATPEEIASHLIEEAKRRYPIGTEFKSLWDNNLIRTIMDDEFYLHSSNILVNKGSECDVYNANDGQWAEIIKEEPIKVGGYEVEFRKGEVKVGCKTISNADIKLIKDVYSIQDRINMSFAFSHTNEDIVFYEDKPLSQAYTIKYDNLSKIIEKLQD